MKLRVHSEEGGSGTGSGPRERGSEEAEPLRVKLASPLTEEVRAARAKEQQVLELARRVFLGASLVSALLNYLRIYGQSEQLLRFYDQVNHRVCFAILQYLLSTGTSSRHAFQKGGRLGSR